MPDISRIDRALKNAVGKVPGMVATVTNANETIYEGAFGVRDITRDTKMTMDTTFFYASMTKAITSVAAMQLVEQGKIALDEVITSLLPEIANPHVLDGFDASGKPMLRPAPTAPTIRHLLTHTSGYGSSTWNAKLMRYITERGYPEALTSWDEVKRIPMMFNPGTRWNYGISSDLLGKVIEGVTGKTLDIYWKENITDPLGMRDATVVLSDEQRDRMATAHARQPDGALKVMDYPRGYAPAFLMGAGALCGTADDYTRFLRMVLAGGGNLLTRETVDSMTRNHIGDLTMPVMHSAVPERSANVEFFPGIPKNWGLGFMINTQDVPGRRTAGSLAWAGIANTHYWIDRKAGIAGVILMQVFPFAEETALNVLADFERAVYETFA